jgi:hypothetical protein
MSPFIAVCTILWERRRENWFGTGKDISLAEENQKVQRKIDPKAIKSYIYNPNPLQIGEQHNKRLTSEES